MNNFSIFDTKQFDKVSFNTKYDLYINIELTHQCNFNCWYCYDDHNKNNNTYISIPKLKILFELLKYSNKTVHVDLLGGEPTLHPEFFEILDLLNNYEHIKKVRITTNGTFNNYKEIKQILKKDYVLLYSHHHNKNLKSLVEYFKINNLEVACAFMLDDKKPIEMLETEFELISQFYNTKIHLIYNHSYSKAYLDFFNKNKINHLRNIFIGGDSVVLKDEYFNELYNPFKDKLCDSYNKRFLFDVYGVLSYTCNEDNKFDITKVNIKNFISFLEKNDPCLRNDCNCWLNYVRTK